MTTAQDAPPRRLVFIDVLRLIAAVQMIQGHSIAAVLAPSYRHGLLFQSWTFARGLTSVSFLFSAGFALALAEARARERAARELRAVRALRLLVLGYMLHAPLALLFGAPLDSTLRAFAAVDVLQCIAVSLLSLELLTACCASVRVRIGLASALALAAFFGAKFVHTGPLRGLALAFGDYLSAEGGSQFPLLPWAGYLWAGFALGSLYLVRPARLVQQLAGLGALALTLGVPLLYGLPGPRAVSPGYAFVKLGCVLLLASCLSRALRRVDRLPRALARLASETLFLYASHVLLLYADGVGLAQRLGSSHSPWFGMLLALALLTVCGAAALWLGSLRSRSASGTRAAQSP